MHDGQALLSASIIIVGYRNAPGLRACVDAVRRHVPAHLAEVLVVLNEPTPQLRAQTASAWQDVTVWSFRTNLGFAGAVNFAAERARGEHIVLLNDDTLVEPGWLEALLDTAARRPAAGAVGSTFLHMDGTLQEAASVLWSDGTTNAVGDGTASTSWNFERRADYCSGGALLVRRALWDALGGLDEQYFPAYYEDVDLCLRLAAEGWETWYSPASRLRHVRSSSSAAQYRSFIIAANRERFRRRWAHQLAQRVAAPSMEAAVWQAMHRRERVLVIDDRVPDAALGSGFGRAEDMLFALAADPALHVTLHPRDDATGDTRALSARGIRIVADLPAHLATPGVDYETVVVSRPHNAEIYGALLRERLPRARYVYDAEALYHRRIQTQLALVTHDDRRRALQAEAETMRALELRLVRDADAVVCISEAEADIVRAHTAAPVTVVPALMTTPTPSTRPFGRRADIGFVAGWLAGPGSPNCDALLWFACQVLPLIQAEVPGLRLRVTGVLPPVDVIHLAGADVQFVGRIADLGEFYDQVRVVVAPTRIGAGVKLKTVEAVQYGVPVVATSEGAAGLDGEWREAIWVADSPQRFAAGVIDLLRDPWLWRQRRECGLALVARHRTARHDSRIWADVVRRERTTVATASENVHG